MACSYRNLLALLVLGVQLAGCADEVVTEDAQSDDSALRERVVPPVDPSAIFGFNVMGLGKGEWPSVTTSAVRIWDVLGSAPGSGAAWSRIEVAPGVYDWSVLDAAVQNAQLHGAKTISYVISGTPSFYATSVDAPDCPLLWDADPNTRPEKPYLCSAPWVGKDSASVPSSRGMTAFVEFAKAVATRYAGRITAYEIWNEPSLAMFWRGSQDESSWDILANMTKRACAAIGAADANAAVLSASLVPRNDGWESGRDPRYLRALAKVGWPVDAYNFHGYPEVGTVGADRHEQQIERVRKMLFETLKAPKKDLWETEHNYNVGGPGNPQDPALTAGQIARSYVSVTTRRVRTLFWYAWHHDDETAFGANFADATPAAAAFDQMRAWFEGTKLQSDDERNGVVTARYASSAGPRTIAFVRSGRASLPRPSGVAWMCTAGSRICQPAPATIPLTATPVLLTATKPAGHT